MFKGTVIAQIIAVVSSIYIAKLYGSEAYGVLSVFICLSTILSTFNSLQLDNCIILSKKKNSTNWFNFLFLLIPIMTLVGALLSLPIYFLFYKNNLNSITFILVLIASIFLSYNKTHEFLLTNLKIFSPFSFGKILIVIVNVSLQFIFYLNFKIYGLIYSSIISVITVSLYYSFKNKRYFKSIDYKLVKQDIKQHTTIIKYLLPSRFINSLAIQSIPILIFALFSLKETGVFFFSQKILSMPLFIISSSISNVYFEKAKDLYQSSKKELFYATRKIIGVNIIIILAFLVLINTVGVYILELFLNKNWENLRIYILVLSFLILAKSSFSPISNIIVILNKNNISLLFNLYLLFINGISFYFGYLNNNLLFAIYLLSFLGGLGYFSLAFYFLKTLKKLKNEEEITF